MGLYEVSILVGCAILVAAGLVRLGHLWSVVRAFRPADSSMESAALQLARNRRREQEAEGEEQDESEDLGVALALAIRDAESTAKSGAYDPE